MLALLLALSCGCGEGPGRPRPDAAVDAALFDARSAETGAGADAATCPQCERLVRCCAAANAANTCDPPCGVVEGLLQTCRAGGGGGLDPAALEAGCARSLELYAQSRPEIPACTGG